MRFSDARVFDRSGRMTVGDVEIGGVFGIEGVSPDRVRGMSGDNIYVFPGFTDVHVHFREPGFSYKETVESGRAAAARGGYTDVFTMPNLSPVPDSAENLALQLELIGKSDTEVGVTPYGAITVGEKGERLADLAAMAPYVCGFSDDGRGVADPALMLSAMKVAAELGKPIVAHCEDMTLVRGGCIHDGDFAREHGLPGICSESEWGPIKRDIELVKQSGCSYHVCHVSTKESVELIRQAKRDGVDITCETAPHYLTLTDRDLRDEGRFKMNPPIREEADRLALLEGIIDGTVDIIATDHAPRSAEEKSRGLLGSLMGVVGLETAFPIMYTRLVKTGALSLSRLVELMAIAPRRRFVLPDEDNSFTVWDLGYRGRVDPKDFLTKGRSTPFEGEEIYGRCLLTVKNGHAVYVDPSIKA